MGSDEDYQAFLEKANQDTSTATSKSAPADGKPIGAREIQTDVPAALTSIEEYYVSDSDEPFEPLSLKFNKDRLPSHTDMAQLLNTNRRVAQIEQSDFDPHGKYTKVIEAVKGAGSLGPAFFRVQDEGDTRLEYYIVAQDVENGRLVGLRAKAVES